jgi:hypothetical protein
MSCSPLFRAGFCDTILVAALGTSIGVVPHLPGRPPLIGCDRRCRHDPHRDLGGAPGGNRCHPGSTLALCLSKVADMKSHIVVPETRHIGPGVPPGPCSP